MARNLRRIAITGVLEIVLMHVADFFDRTFGSGKKLEKVQTKTVFLSSSFSFSFVLVVDLFLTSFLVIETCWPQTNLTLEFQRLLTTVFGLKGTYDVLILLSYFSNGPRIGQL